MEELSIFFMFSLGKVNGTSHFEREIRLELSSSVVVDLVELIVMLFRQFCD